MDRTPCLAIAAVVVLATTTTHATAASLGRLTFTITKGTVSCGWPALSPPSLPPFSGEVDTDGTKRSDLGLGCLYFGGGGAGMFPGTPIPDGGRSVLGVTGISLSGLALTLGADPGARPAKASAADEHAHFRAGVDSVDVRGFPDAPRAVLYAGVPRMPRWLRQPRHDDRA
jgi:hypothetical protein